MKVEIEAMATSYKEMEGILEEVAAIEKRRSQDKKRASGVEYAGQRDSYTLKIELINSTITP